MTPGLGLQSYQEMYISKYLDSSQSKGEIKAKFEHEKTYSLCFRSSDSGRKNVFFEFPLQTSQAVGNSKELGEGVQVIQSLSAQIQMTADTVQQTLSRTSLFDKVYNEMETNIYASFTVKTAILLGVCILQCWIFMRMIDTSLFKYSRVGTLPL